MVPVAVAVGLMGAVGLAVGVAVGSVAVGAVVVPVGIGAAVAVEIEVGLGVPFEVDMTGCAPLLARCLPGQPKTKHSCGWAAAIVEARQ